MELTVFVKHVFILGLLMLLPVRAVTADVQAFTDKDEWIEAVGDFAFIDFVGIPNGTDVTDQYEELGVVFDPNVNVIFEHPIFPDGFGLIGSQLFPISFSLLEPQNWIAVDFPGMVQFQLFLGDKLVCESELFFAFGGNIAFAGIVSSTPFDRVIIQDPTDLNVGIDNLYVGVLESGPDVNGDGTVDVQDLIAVLLAWGTADRAADVTNDGIVDVADLIEVISNWS